MYIQVMAKPFVPFKANVSRRARLSAAVQVLVAVPKLLAVLNAPCVEV